MHYLSFFYDFILFLEKKDYLCTVFLAGMGERIKIDPASATLLARN